MGIFTRFRQGFIGLLCLTAFAACSPKPTAQTQNIVAENTPPFALTLTNTETDKWRFDIDLFEPQSALIFSRSRHDYRAQTYVPVSAGAQLKRIGGFDTIIFDEGVMSASFEITPFTETLPGTYTHFIPFSDGGQAVYLGAFELLRVTNVEAVTDLQGNIDAWNGEQFDIPFHLKSDTDILLNGDILSGYAETTIHGNGPYAYIGPTALVEGQSFSGVLDPGLPEWLVETLDEDLSKIFKGLEGGFGYDLENRATIMFAFRGYDTQGFSNTGGVLPGGLMVMETSGDAMREPNERLRGYLQWFLTHESTHLFQHPDGVTYADKSDSWILEGGANAITHTLLNRVKTIPNEVIQNRYKDGFAYCVDAIQNASMADITRRDNQSHYDCGDFVFRISDAALPQHDVFDIWAALLTQANDENSYDSEDYFTALRNLGAEENLVKRLESFVAGPVENPATELREMMASVGIKASLKDGELMSIQFP